MMHWYEPQPPVGGHRLIFRAVVSGLFQQVAVTTSIAATCLRL